VWPVGAVSKTTTEKFIPFTNLKIHARESKVNKNETQENTSYQL
jgi:hypothetical protein